MKTFKTLSTIVATTLMMATSAAAFDSAEFEAEQAIGESDAALFEAQEMKQRLVEAKKEEVEAKAKARATASEAKSLEKQASKMTRTVEKEINAVNEQTALFKTQIAANEAYKKQYQVKMAAARANLEKAKKNRDQVLQTLKAQKAKR